MKNIFSRAWPLSLLAACAIAQAQSYPSRPIRLIIPLPPGGPTDIIPRLTGQIVSDQLKQPFIYDNRPGANTIIATDLCAKSKPDGYTACVMLNAAPLNHYLQPKLPFHYLKDFTPVINLAESEEGLYLSSSIPAKNLKEFIEYTKANPSKISFGSLGIGSNTHLLPEYIAHSTGAKITHIPFKGLPELWGAFMNGDIQLAYLSTSAPAIMEGVKAGTVKVLLTSRKSVAFPDAPTLSDLGLPDPKYTAWFGIVMPEGTPKEMVLTLNKAFAEALKAPGVLARLGQMNMRPIGGSPEDFGTALTGYDQSAERLVEGSGFKMDR